MIKCILFDWGDTLMKVFPEYRGAMVSWPQVAAIPGAAEMLRTLQARGFITAIASNAGASSETEIRAALGRVELDGLIERVYCFRKIGHKKPSPEFFAYILADLGLEPGALLMVGDDFEADVLGAVHCGIRAIWFNPNGLERREGEGYRTIHALEELMGEVEEMSIGLIYTERISSNKTEALFLALMILFLSLLIWRVNTSGFDILAAVYFCFFILFLFYSVNYRTLLIQLTAKSLKLKFGIFTWRVPLDNVEECGLDEIPLLKRMGGAGIHFMIVHNRYRASFNFLEYPRVVISFKRKVGPVRDISFSTRHPDEVLRLIQDEVSA